MDVLPDQIGRRLRDAAEELDRLRAEVDRDLPERLALAAVVALKRRARRRDVVGDVAHHALRLLSQGLTPRGETPPARR
jgi:hypothetical protein